MPQGDKSAYTGKQKRKAAAIADSYRERGVPEGKAEARAWATVNKDSGGGNKSGSGRGQPDGSASKRRKQVSDSRSAAARKGWETRRSRAG